MRMFFASLGLAALLAAAPAAALSVPAAVVHDPPVDRANAPKLVPVLIPSAGLGMNGVMLQAQGPGRHPTMLLLHGLPGYEQNIDLAQAVRRAGWNVLLFHPRGSWGSPGDYSFSNAIADADAAAAYLRRPDIVEKFQIDPRRVVIAGHSFGGFCAAAHARHDPGLAGVILIDPPNVGGQAKPLRSVPRAARAAVADKIFADLGNTLHGATPVSLAEDALAHADAWDDLDWGPQLTRAPVLVIGASGADGYGKEAHALAQAIAHAHGRVTQMTMDTDHVFSDHRIALEAAVVRWLEALPR